MAGVLQELPEGAAVAVVRLRSLGDCVLTTPALSILKQARPDLRLAVVVEERFADIFVPNPDVDAVLPPSVTAVRGLNPVLCLNLHGGTRSMALTTASGAGWRAGFAHFRAPAVYNVKIPTAQEILGVERKVHTAEHLASAMFYLGAPPSPIPAARLFVQGMGYIPLANARGSGLSRDRKGAVIAQYAVIHPVAATPEKTWPAERFLAIARHVSRDYEPVFIGGPGDDLSAFTEFRTVAGAPLQDTKTLLASAALFIGNDSGPAHMAAAFGVPVVVLFGPSDPVVWAPWQVEARTLVGKDGDIRTIRITQVIEALEEIRVTQ